MPEFSTRELLDALESDFLRASNALIASIQGAEDSRTSEHEQEHFYLMRQVVRTAFAYMEGTTFSLKLTATKACVDKGIDVSQAERYLVGEIEHRVNDGGEVVQRPAHIRLTANIRFAFNLAERAWAKNGLFDPSSDWWACLQASVKVRDRLTHPRWPMDLEVSPDEMMQMIKAKDGFTNLVRQYAVASAA